MLKVFLTTLIQPVQSLKDCIKRQSLNRQMMSYSLNLKNTKALQMAVDKF